MASFTVPASGTTPISATETVSPSIAVPLGLQGATIQMTACPEWSTASGWFSWGVEASFDGGATWAFVVSQGYVDPHQLAIGALGRSGGLPSLAVAWDRTLGNARARMTAKTDGAVLHCAFLITTTP